MANLIILVCFLVLHPSDRFLKAVQADKQETKAPGSYHPSFDAQRVPQSGVVQVDSQPIRGRYKRGFIMIPHTTTPSPPIPWGDPEDPIEGHQAVFFVATKMPGSPDHFGDNGKRARGPGRRSNSIWSSNFLYKRGRTNSRLLDSEAGEPLRYMILGNDRTTTPGFPEENSGQDYFGDGGERMKRPFCNGFYGCQNYPKKLGQGGNSPGSGGGGIKIPGQSRRSVTGSDQLGEGMDIAREYSRGSGGSMGSYRNGYHGNDVRRIPSSVAQSLRGLTENSEGGPNGLGSLFSGGKRLKRKNIPDNDYLNTADQLPWSPYFGDQRQPESHSKIRVKRPFCNQFTGCSNG